MNALLKELGFEPDDRVVVVHADDVGMCQATIPAWLDLAEGGLLSSASVMPVSPWFPHVAEICRKRPELDVGVHLAITSEWDTYPVGPVAFRDPATGLVDDSGCFWPTVTLCWEHSREDAVRAEIAVQLRRGSRHGDRSDPRRYPHARADYPSFLHSYVETALSASSARPDSQRRRSLPALLPRTSPRSETCWPPGNSGVPVFDRLAMFNLSDTGRRVRRRESRVRRDPTGSHLPGLPPGEGHSRTSPHDYGRWLHRVNEYSHRS